MTTVLYIAASQPESDTAQHITHTSNVNVSIIVLMFIITPSIILERTDLGCMTKWAGIGLMTNGVFQIPKPVLSCGS